MRNRNPIIALVVGILFGGLAFFLLYQKASELDRKTTPVQVWVASRYIPARTFLKEGMMEKKNIPESFISPSAIHDLREVDGLMTLVPISAGEQILSNKFGQVEETLANTLNPGFRAYTLEVSETTGVGHLLRPGDHVDLLAKIGAKNKQDVTTFVFQNLQVIAVGQKTNWSKHAKRSAMDQANNLSESDETGASYSNVTLAVTPEQAETLLFLEGSNPIRLVLRAPGDEEIVAVPQQSEAEVLSRLGHFSQSRSKKIEVIRGAQSSEKGENQ